MFRVIQEYDGSDSVNCIALKYGDKLSAVQFVDGYWCQGLNERSGETGAFPEAFVEEIKEDSERLKKGNLKHKVQHKNMTGTEKTPDDDKMKMDKAKKTLEVSVSDNVATRGFKRLKESDKFTALHASTDMLFKTGREENRKIKAAFGVFVGFLIGCLLFILLVYSFGYSSLVAGIMVALITILMCVALALWSACRCVMALVFPNFFTSKGRSVMISIILSLALTGPIQNITNNARVTGSSMACIAEVVANQTRAMRYQLAEPMRQIADYAIRNQKKLEEAQRGITDHFDTFMRGYDTIDNEIKGFTNQLDVIYKKCETSIENAYDSCKDNCGPVSFVCAEPCKVLNPLKEVCKAATISSSGINDARSKVSKEFDEVRNYFKADVVIKGNFDTSTNSSKHIDSIKADIDSDINGTVYTFKQFTNVAKKVMSITLLLMFLKAFWYFRSYMSKDDYNNKYITKEFIELDKTRASMGETPILPLKKRELSKYIQPRSLRLNSLELGYCQKGVAQVLILLLLCIIIIVGDYCLYYVLNLVSRFGNVVVRLNANASFKITVQGTGPIAEFYKILLGDFDITKHYLNDVEIGGCLPTPTAPSTEYSIVAFVVLYVILMCVVLLRAYGMRLRRKIAAYYYPEQEKQRLEYLYKKIKHERQAYQRFIRQEVKSAHKESKMKETFRLSSWLRTRFPCCMTCIATNKKLQCSSCEETDQQLLFKCNGVIDERVCTVVYCEDCRNVLNGVCPLCNKDDVELRG